jgi:hypothetical protein
MTTNGPSESPFKGTRTGISAGATAGIGVGAGLAVIILALVLWWIFRSRSCRSSAPASSPPTKEEKADMDSVGISSLPNELPTEQNGIVNPQRPAELYGEAINRTELPGGAKGVYFS